MYGENGAQKRSELAALRAERAQAGRQVPGFWQTILVWCTHAIGIARPLAFANVPTKPPDPFGATD